MPPTQFNEDVQGCHKRRDDLLDRYVCVPCDLTDTCDCCGENHSLQSQHVLKGGRAHPHPPCQGGGVTGKIWPPRPLYIYSLKVTNNITTLKPWTEGERDIHRVPQIPPWHVWPHQGPQRWHKIWPGNPGSILPCNQYTHVYQCHTPKTLEKCYGLIIQRM